VSGWAVRSNLPSAKTVKCWGILAQLPEIKFHENPFQHFLSSYMQTAGRTDRQTDMVNSAFLC
jgi:hypothetical protein